MKNFETYKLEVKRTYEALLKHERYLREFGANSRCAHPCPHDDLETLYKQGKQDYPDRFLDLFSSEDTEKYG